MLGTSTADGIGRVPRGINDGKGFVFISHLGEIFPSGFLPVSAGNVRKQSLTEIYRHSPLFVSLRDSTNLKGKCGICEFREVCGGSRARAYALTGDVFAEEPCCVGARLRRLVGIIEELSFTTVRHRLASFLLRLAQKEGKRTAEGVEITMPVSNQELASQIGTVRELVSRNLSRLQAEGMIKIDGRSVVICDLKTLGAETDSAE